MSKLLENKQLLHVASEVVILVSLVYYINQKNKKLMGYIEDLVQRIEEQDDMINRHEQFIKNYLSIANQKNVQQPNIQTNIQPNLRQIPTKQNTNQSNDKSDRIDKPEKQKNTKQNLNKQLSNKKILPEQEIQIITISNAPESATNTSYIEELENDDEAENNHNAETSTNLDEELRQELEELDE